MSVNNRSRTTVAVAAPVPETGARATIAVPDTRPSEARRRTEPWPVHGSDSDIGAEKVYEGHIEAETFDLYDHLFALPNSPTLMSRLGWNDADAVEFQALWLLMKRNFDEDLAAFGVDVMLWILDTIPGAKNVFLNTHPDRKTKTKRVIDDVFMTHGFILINVLDRMIESLDESALTLVMMQTMVRQHIHLNIKVRTFEVLRDNFSTFLKDSVGFSKKSRQAALWYQFFTALTTVYKEENECINGPPHEDRGCCSLM